MLRKIILGILMVLTVPRISGAEKAGIVVIFPDQPEDAIMQHALPFPAIVGWQYKLSPTFPYEVQAKGDEWLESQHGHLYTDGVSSYLFVYPGTNGAIDATTETISLMLSPEFLSAPGPPQSLADDDYVRFDLDNTIFLTTEFGISSSRTAKDQNRFSYNRSSQLHSLLVRLITDYHGIYRDNTPLRTNFVVDSRRLGAALETAWGGTGRRIHFDVSRIEAEKRFVISIAAQEVPAFTSCAEAKAALTALAPSGNLLAAGIIPEKRGSWLAPNGEPILMQQLIPSMDENWVAVPDECCDE